MKTTTEVRVIAKEGLVKVGIDLPVVEMVKIIPLDAMWEYWRHYDYMLLDRIGVERVKEYFGLVERS